MTAVLKPLCCLALAASSLLAPAASAQPTADETRALATARADVDTLTSARYGGRGYAGPDGRAGGAARAAAYVARRFEALGLRPFEGGTSAAAAASGSAARTAAVFAARPASGFVRPFPFTTDLVERATLGAGRARLRLGDDFLPFPGAASGAGEAATVDVGAGVVLPAFGLDAYAGRAVAGRVVVVSREAPDSLRNRPGVPPAAFSFEARIEAAAARGARAVVFLTDDLPAYGAPRYTAPVPAFTVRRAAWAARRRVAWAVRARQGATVMGQNVVGYVPGTARPESLLVVTAHLDHLGTIGGDVPVVFPGANDNASGSALLLALAGEIARRPLRYTVVFAATGGEELGLHGATALASDPPFSLAHVRFLVNFDMVASGTAGLLAFGGPEAPGEYALLSALNDGLGRGPLAARGNRPNSDHFPFTQRGVRAFYLLTNGGAQPYHSPRDVAATLEWDDWAHAYALARAFLSRLAG